MKIVYRLFYKNEELRRVPGDTLATDISRFQSILIDGVHYSAANVAKGIMNFDTDEHVIKVTLEKV